jgi:hypothetical protein
MADLKRGIIHARVKPGSALERILSASPHKTISGALHELAAAYEALKAATSR